MPDETNQANETQGNAPDPQEQSGKTGQSGETSAQSSGRTYTEAELNAIITSRLTKHERALKKSWEDQQADARRQAELSAEERAKEAEKKASEVMAQAEAKLQEAGRRAALAGKVRDVDYALFKVAQDENLFDKEGNVDVTKYLKAYPDQTVARPGPAPTSAAGGSTEKVDMNTLLRREIERRR